MKCRAITFFACFSNIFTSALNFKASIDLTRLLQKNAFYIREFELFFLLSLIYQLTICWKEKKFINFRCSFNLTEL